MELEPKGPTNRNPSLFKFINSYIALNERFTFTLCSTFGVAKAKHLLRRATFNYSKSAIDTISLMSPSEALSLLTSDEGYIYFGTFLITKTTDIGQAQVNYPIVFLRKTKSEHMWALGGGIMRFIKQVSSIN